MMKKITEKHGYEVYISKEFEDYLVELVAVDEMGVAFIANVDKNDGRIFTFITTDNYSLVNHDTYMEVLKEAINNLVKNQDEQNLQIQAETNMKYLKYYIHLYDYEQGKAIFESQFFDTEKEALEFAKACNFVYNDDISVDLMGLNEDEYAEFIRHLEHNEYGNLGSY